MPSLIDMRRRIRAVKSTQQITKAMKMVAASKLRRAQEQSWRRVRSRAKARRVLASIASRVDQTCIRCWRGGRRGQRPRAVMSSAAIAACAAASTRTSSRRSAFMRENPGRPISLGLVGRKGRDMLTGRGAAGRGSST
jgi:F-type H+-transporting ATPase subunit gamma